MEWGFLYFVYLHLASESGVVSCGVSQEGSQKNLCVADFRVFWFFGLDSGSELGFKMEVGGYVHWQSSLAGVVRSLIISSTQHAVQAIV